MRRLSVLLACVLVVPMFAAFTLASEKGLEGRWTGSTQTPQGEVETSAVFKKEGEAYSGTITGMRGDMALSDIKVEGEKVTARAEVETQRGVFVIFYSFVLKEDALNGRGDIDFGGQSFSFDVYLKRVVE